MALAVASALALVSLPVAAQTSQWQLPSNPIASAATHINTTQINFGGHEWVVIGNTSKDIYQGSHDGGTYGHANAAANSVTLLSISDDFGNSEFRATGSGCGSYAGSCVGGRPHEYQGSTLQGAMNAIAGGLGKELGVINERDLESIGDIAPSYDGGNYPELNNADGINGADATGLYWALSYPEWRAIAYGIGSSEATTVRSFPSSWWLRSPDDYVLGALAGLFGGGSSVNFSVHLAYVVRPAFNLDLTSVLFTSETNSAIGATKFGVTAGDAYNSAAQPTSGAQKFTFLTSSIATPTLVLNNTPLDFTFSDAPLVDTTPNTPAGAKQYVSGFLTKDTTTDLYARYVDTTSSATGSFNAADPSGGSPLATGDYILHIFSEEANTYLYSDFASHSVDFTFNVNSGTVENLTLTSDSAFGLDGGTIGLLTKNYTKAWTLGTGGGIFDIQSGVTAQISGAIGGSGSLTKDGDGTLILSNASNSYSGATTINEGTLELTGSLLNTSGVSVANGATLALRGGLIGGSGISSVTLAGAGSTLNVYGSSSAPFASGINGDLTTNGGTLNFFLPSDIAHNDTLLAVAGTADISNSAVTISKDGSFGSFSSLYTGAKINLIQSSSLVGFNTLSYTSVPLYSGVSFATTYEFALLQEGENLVAMATVTTHS
ncbi:hypothetical protein FACS1894158_05830 [Betaproteobacteria bacterium]|nr:hypothetical protein FACS1894158_05830 [Betaproteobacteria bacterium]